MNIMVLFWLSILFHEIGHLMMFIRKTGYTPNIKVTWWGIMIKSNFKWMSIGDKYDVHFAGVFLGLPIAFLNMKLFIVYGLVSLLDMLVMSALVYLMFVKHLSPHTICASIK